MDARHRLPCLRDGVLPFDAAPRLVRRCRRLTTLAGALIGALFTLPFFGPTLAAWRLWGNPQFMTAIAVTSLTLCAFLAIGRTRVKIDIALAAAIVGLLSYLIVSQPVRAAGHFAPRAPTRVQPLLRCADREFHPGSPHASEYQPGRNPVFRPSSRRAALPLNALAFRLQAARHRGYASLGTRGARWPD